MPSKSLDSETDPKAEIRRNLMRSTHVSKLEILVKEFKPSKFSRLRSDLKR